MFAYLAFKALTGRYPDALKSAHQKTPWKFDSTLGLPCLKAAKGTFREGHGVYATTVEEAQKYAEDYQAAVYLVAPLPRKRAVVGEAGWRAEAAVCLGPLTKENAPQIARLVLIAHSQGLPQVKDVLHWAVEQVCLEAWWATPYRDLVLRALDELRDAPFLYIAGTADPGDERVSNAVHEAFWKRPTIESAWCYWSGYYCSNVAWALALTGDAKYLYLAGRNWRDEYFYKSISKALVETRNAMYLYLAGRDWPDKRFTPEIAQALVETRDAMYLCLAGNDWSEKRFTLKIAQALAETKDADYLYEAGQVWPEERFMPEIAQALAETRDAWDLYLAGRDWSEKRFTPQIAQALAETGDAERLYLAGKDWADRHFSPAIAEALIKTGNAKYLYLAGRDWPGRRFCESITQALVETGDAEHICLAGRDWPAERVSDVLKAALRKYSNAY